MTFFTCIQGLNFFFMKKTKMKLYNTNQFFSVICEEYVKVKRIMCVCSAFCVHLCVQFWFPSVSEMWS